MVELLEEGSGHTGEPGRSAEELRQIVSGVQEKLVLLDIEEMEFEFGLEETETAGRAGQTYRQIGQSFNRHSFHSAKVQNKQERSTVWPLLKSIGIYLLVSGILCVYFLAVYDSFVEFFLRIREADFIIGPCACTVTCPVFDLGDISCVVIADFLPYGHAGH